MRHRVFNDEFLAGLEALYQSQSMNLSFYRKLSHPPQIAHTLIETRCKDSVDVAEDAVFRLEA